MAGGCMEGARGEGIHGRGVCMVGGMHGRGACVAGVCMVGDYVVGMHGGGHAWQVATHAPPGRYYNIRSMSGQYASYWNAFLL